MWITPPRLLKFRVVKLIDRQRISTVWTVKGGHGQWTARCPAHDDRRASLSVSVGEGPGTAELSCWMLHG